MSEQGEIVNKVANSGLINFDISDLIPKVEENKPAVELPKTEEEKKEEQINVDEVFDKYIKDEGVISLYFHNKLYIDYKERQEIVNDETLNNNILKNRGI